MKTVKKSLLVMTVLICFSLAHQGANCAAPQQDTNDAAQNMNIEGMGLSMLLDRYAAITQEMQRFLATGDKSSEDVLQAVLTHQWNAQIEELKKQIKNKEYLGG